MSAYNSLIELCGSRAKVITWLNQPNPFLNYCTPILLLENDRADEVQNVVELLLANKGVK